MLIKRITINGLLRNFLIDSETKKQDNYFTIIIGKNASGKSEILKEACHLLIRSQIEENFESSYIDRLDHYLDRNYKDNLHRGEKSLCVELEMIHNDETFKYKYIRTDEDRKFINFLGETKYFKDQVFRHEFHVTDDSSNKKTHYRNHNIISVSSGQFDKFPVLQSMGLSSGTGINYSYIGVQNDKLSSQYDNILSLKVGEIGLAIIKFCVESKKTDFSALLSMLGLNGKVKIKYEVDKHLLSRDFNNQDELLINGARYSSIGLGDGGERLNENDILYLKKAIYNLNEKHPSHQEKNGEVEIDILSDEEIPEAMNLYYAAKIDSITIKDITLNGTRSISSLLSASSGQINLLNIFFGISSCITDNSLILIDEPEISLHTDWQINFIPLIKKSFCKFKDCHYIIATHAPMIISNIGLNHSSILNMTTGETISSNKFNKQSSDFINSYLFETPGPKNETINREVVSLLSAISKRKKLTESDFQKAKLLIKWSHELTDGDPTKDLVNILGEALEVYTYDN